MRYSSFSYLDLSVNSLNSTKEKKYLVTRKSCYVGFKCWDSFPGQMKKKILRKMTFNQIEQNIGKTENLEMS